MLISLVKNIARLLEVDSKSWIRRVYKRVRAETVREIVPGVLWQVGGLLELGDREDRYDVWRRGSSIVCSCQYSSWGYARRLCTHIGAVLTRLLLELENDTSTVKIVLVRRPLSHIARVQQTCRPLIKEVSIGFAKYTVIACTCGLCDYTEIFVEKSNRVYTRRKMFFRVPLRFALLFLPELAKYVAEH